MHITGWMDFKNVTLSEKNWISEGPILYDLIDTEFQHERSIKSENKSLRVRNVGSDEYDCKSVAWEGSLRWCDSSVSRMWWWLQPTLVLKWHKTLGVHCGNVVSCFDTTLWLYKDETIGRNGWREQGTSLYCIWTFPWVSIKTNNNNNKNPLPLERQ